MFILKRHKARSQLSVSLRQIRSAYSFALESGRWTGQALLGHYLVVYRKRYGFEQRLSASDLAKKAQDIEWLAHDFGETAPKVIDVLMNAEQLNWVNNKWQALTDPKRVGDWVVPVLQHELTKRKPGEQSEWAIGPAASPGKETETRSWVDRL